MCRRFEGRLAGATRRSGSRHFSGLVIPAGTITMSHMDALGADSDALPSLPDPRISLVVGTWSSDRWEDVARLVRSARTQTRELHEFVLVVDHNPELLNRAQRAFSDVVCMPNCNERGAAGVKNTGLEKAAGDVIAFIDDDVEPEHDWLEALAAGYALPNVLGVGGAIRPRWDIARPSWFPAEFDWVVGCTYTGHRIDAGPVRNLIGANMSIRRDVLSMLGGFRSEVGKVGNRSRPEETDLCLRAQVRWPDGRWIYVPDALVHHRVPPKRATARYFFSRCYHEGRGKADLVAAVGVQSGLSSEKKYVRQTLLSAIVHALVRLPRSHDIPSVKRAGTMAAGLAVTATGYANGALLRHLDRVRSKVASRI